MVIAIDVLGHLSYLFIHSLICWLLFPYQILYNLTLDFVLVLFCFPFTYSQSNWLYLNNSKNFGYHST